MAGRRHGRLGRLVGAGIVAWSAAVSAAPPVAASPDTPDRAATDRPAAVSAQQLFDEGSHAYSLGNFALAIQKFEAAYDLTQAVELLYNIALAYTRRHALAPDLDHLRKARLLFENFANIRAANGADIRDARERIAQLDQQIGGIEAARVETERLAAERLAAERLAAERLAAERWVAEPRAAPPAPTSYSPGGLGIAGYAGLGVGLLLGSGLATAGFFSAARLRDQHTDEAGSLSLPAGREALYAHHVGEAQALGFIGVGVGAALAVTAVALIVVDARRGRATSRRAAIGPFGVSVAF